MDEQGQTTGTEGTTGTVAERLAEQAPEIAKSEPRKCYQCGALSGNGAGIFDEGRPIFDQALGRHLEGYICPDCKRKESADFRRNHPIIAREVLVRIVAEMNAVRDAERAAAKAAREADGKKYEQAMAYWVALAAGKVKLRFTARGDKEGNCLCGDPRCPYCGGKDLAKQFVVVWTTEGVEVIGLCVHQGAALRDSKVSWIKLPRGARETCEVEAKRRQDGLFYALDLYEGKVERPRPILDGKGRLLCSVPGCDCGNEPAEYGLVGERHLDMVGLCLTQFICFWEATQRGANFFIARRVKCEQHLSELHDRVRHALCVNCGEHPRQPKRSATLPAKPAESKKAAEPKPPEPPVLVVPAVTDDDIAAAATRGRISFEQAAAAGDPVAIDTIRLNKRAEATCGAKAKKGGKKDGDKDGKPGKGGRGR